MAKRIVLVRFVNEGSPSPTDFRYEDVPAPTDCADNECILALRYISADPYMRGRMKQAKSYAASFQPNESISGFVVAEVTASKNPAMPVGEVVGGNLPYITVQVVDAATAMRMWKLSGLVPPEKYSYGIGALGMPGLTAYFGLNEVLQPAAGETLYVNGAAGAVGSLVGQIAKLKGVTVIGSAGGPEKCAKVKGMGFDACLDYKATPTAEALREQLAAAAPKGINMYFENVGGMQFDAVFPLLANRARVAVCGAIDTYNAAAPVVNPISLGAMIVKQIKIEGLLVFRWMGQPDLLKKGLMEMSSWIKDGKLQVEETVLEGLERFGEAFCGLFTGLNTGKMVVKV